MKVLGLITIVMLLLFFTACQKKETAAEPEKAPEKEWVMAMVTNQSGLGDQAFNDATWAGFELAEKELGITKKVLESREQAQYVPNLSALADQKVDLVVGVGFMIKDLLFRCCLQAGWQLSGEGREMHWLRSLPERLCPRGCYFYLIQRRYYFAGSSKYFDHI